MKVSNVIGKGKETIHAIAAREDLGDQIQQWRATTLARAEFIQAAPGRWVSFTPPNFLVTRRWHASREAAELGVLLQSFLGYRSETE